MYLDAKPRLRAIVHFNIFDDPELCDNLKCTSWPGGALSVRQGVEGEFSVRSGVLDDFNLLFTFNTSMFKEMAAKEYLLLIICPKVDGKPCYNDEATPNYLRDYKWAIEKRLVDNGDYEMQISFKKSGSASWCSASYTIRSGKVHTVEMTYTKSKKKGFSVILDGIEVMSLYAGGFRPGVILH